jgi:hypothetical protein
MTDDEKQKKKVDDLKLDVAQTPAKTSIDLALDSYKATMVSMKPSLDAGIYNAARTVLRVGETLDSVGRNSSLMVSGIPIIPSSHPDSVFGLENNVVFPGIFPSRKETLTIEEVEKLIEKKLPSKKDDGLKKEQVIEIFNEITENRNKQENENILIVNKNGLDFITKELLAGKERDWRCAKCGKPLEIFKGEEGIEKIKKYLVDFRNNIPKKCGNGHDNWFELKEDGINWVVKVIYGKEFRLKS